MPTDSGTNDILSLGFLHYTTAVSREMSDEPILKDYQLFICETIIIFVFHYSLFKICCYDFYRIMSSYFRAGYK